MSTAIRRFIKRFRELEKAYESVPAYVRDMGIVRDARPNRPCALCQARKECEDADDGWEPLVKFDP